MYLSYLSVYLHQILFRYVQSFNICQYCFTSEFFSFAFMDKMVLLLKPRILVLQNYQILESKELISVLKIIKNSIIIMIIWLNICRTLDPEHTSYPHGQCRSVGVGGFLLGGGVNWLGTWNK